MQTSIYAITEGHRTVVSNYNQQAPFASFFPGIAGLNGIPLWAFYVNRGQCVSGFGVEDKSGAIVEFRTALLAYRDTPLNGFRTFLQVGERFYEPFRPGLQNRQYDCRSRMSFDPVSLSLEEENPALQLRVRVTYQTVPGEPWPALARRVTIENLGRAAIHLKWADGLPRLMPVGLHFINMKCMLTTLSSKFIVRNIDGFVPFYQSKCVDGSHTTGPGNFALYSDGEELLPILVNPQLIFGPNTSLDVPEAFLEPPAAEPENRCPELTMPMAMSCRRHELAAGQTITRDAMFGRAHTIEALAEVAALATTNGWFETKQAENKRVIDTVTNGGATWSADPLFDGYSRQNFLDNVLRGGLPVTVADHAGRKHVLQVYARIHGDMERDYNQFVLEPTFYSQGNGGYRDMLQNRRNDIYVNPDVGADCIRMFVNEIFLDGYNPHNIWGYVYSLKADCDVVELTGRLTADDADAAVLQEVLRDSYTPGQVLTELSRRGVEPVVDAPVVLGEILSHSIATDRADTLSGYWTDHWHYNLDTIDSFLSVFPDRLDHLLFTPDCCTYAQSLGFVRPRAERYELVDGEPRPQNFLETPKEHDWMARTPLMWVRTRGSDGDIYTTTLFAKLLALVPLKMATLDPFDVGIEFEAGRANWNDALHNMNELFGSSTNETLELLRLVNFLLAAGEQTQWKEVRLTTEQTQLVRSVEAALKECPGDDPDTLLAYWDRTNTAKERFRECTRHGIDGAEEVLTRETVDGFLTACRRKLEDGLARAVDPETGLMESYLYHEMTDYDVTENGEIRAKAFKQIRTVPFLEGQMHYLRVLGPGPKARRQYQAVRRSELYDEPLKMYKVCGAVDRLPSRFGGITACTPGLMERETIWLHMEYKYLLEILRTEQFDDFYTDLRHALVAFQPPERYGRSPLENSSFLVPSIAADKELHGRGFYARLSGACAEYVHIQLLMNLGPQPFVLAADGALCFVPRPALPAWLFTPSTGAAEWLRDGEPQTTNLPEDHYAFVLFNRTLMIYINPTGKPTAGADAATMQRIELIDPDGTTTQLAPDAIRGDVAHAVRNGHFAVIKASFA